MASQNACNGPRAANCASIDALRSSTNWVNFKEKYETSTIREASAAVARRFPTKGRSLALSKRARESFEENILAANRGVFRRQRQDRTITSGPAGAQWCAASASDT
jgi:hypothetical protein